MSTTEFQRRCIDAVRYAPNGQISTTDLARKLGTNRLAVNRAMNSLAIKKIAGRIVGPGIWGGETWFLIKV